MTERRLAWALVAPALIVTAAVALFPLGWTVWESLHQHDLRMPWLGRPFVGLDNYVEIVSDGRFWGAMLHTVFFTAVSVALEIGLGLFFALALNRAFRGRGLVRAAVLIPWSIPTVVAALLWRFLFDAQAGIVNAVLVGLEFLDEPVVWFVRAATALVPVVLADVWKTTPFVALLLLAGLQNIDPALYEAAAVDGATASRQLWNVTLPLLRPALAVALIFRTLDSFRVFDLIYVLTRRSGHRDRAPCPLHVQCPVLQPAVRLWRCVVGDHFSGDLPAGAPLFERPGKLHRGGSMRRSGRWAAALALAFLVALVAFPFYWAVTASFTPEARLFERPSLWPEQPVLDHYRALWNERDFWKPIRSSLIVAGTTTLFCVSVGSLAAWALARLRFRGKNAVLGGLLAVSLFPQISLVSPLFLLLRWLRLIDTYPGLILPYLTFAMPLAVWLLTSFFRQLPPDLEEAAAVDGATPWQTFCRVLLPLAAPGLATTSILTFIYCWNEFLFALSFTLGPERQTVPVAIALFRGQYQVPWGQILAAAVVATAPVALLVLAFQRRIVQGLTAGAVKG